MKSRLAVDFCSKAACIHVNILESFLEICRNQHESTLRNETRQPSIGELKRIDSSRYQIAQTRTYYIGGEAMYADNQMIELLNRRDETVISMIQEQYGAFCYQIAYRMLGSREDAEECVNDMLMGVWNSIPPNCPNHLPSYLASLVRKTALQKYEKLHRIKRGGTELAKSLDEISEIIPANTEVEHEIEQRELTAALAAWLHTLPPDAKRLFIARYYMEESVNTLAEKYHMSVAAVKMKLLRLRQQFKTYLEKEGFL